MDLKFLDIAIGTIFIYLLLSLFASTIMELISTVLEFRAQTLERAIKRMLDDGGAAAISKQFYNTAAIKYLGDTWFKKNMKPSYLMPNNFSKALIDIIIEKSGGKEVTMAQIQAGLNQFKIDHQGSAESIKYMETLVRDANGKVEDFIKLSEQWFNDTMSRTTGWYKRKTQWILIIIGFLMAMFFNANTFQVIQYLSDNPKARTEMVERARRYVDTHKETAAAKDTDLVNKADSLIQSLVAQDQAILKLKGPIGWETDFCSGINKIFIEGNVLISLLGWLITALAISLGSAFWFDLLKKLVNLRGSGSSSEPDKREKAKQ